MNRLAKLLLVASVALFLAGVGLAVAQPGSLGDDDETAAGNGTTTTVDDAGTDTTATDTTAGDDELAGETTTTAPTTTSSTTAPPTTGNGSGVGSDGSGTEDTSDDLADTGNESLILAGLMVGGIGLALRRRQTA